MATSDGTTTPEYPRAGELGYVEGYECAVDREDGRVVMSDPPNPALAGETYVSVDPGHFLADVRERR